MAKGWKSRATSVSNSSWKDRATKVETGRKEAAAEGVAQREALGERVSEFITPPDASHVAVSAAQGLTGGFADEMAGGLVGGWQKLSGDARPYNEIYTEIRDSIRDKTYEAREKSPITSFIAENVAASFNPITKGGGVLKSIGQGAMIGAGESTTEDPTGTLLNSAITAGVSGATHGVTNLLTGGFKSPNNIRSRYMGQKAKEFEKRGVLGDPRETSKLLKKARFFKHKKSVFDFSEDTFKLEKGRGNRGYPTREESLANADRGIEDIGQEVDRLVKSSPSKELYYGSDLANSGPLVQRLDDIINKAKDPRKAEKIIQEELEILQHSIDNPVEHTDAFGEIVTEATGVNLTRINQLKANYQRAAKKNFESVDPVFKEKAEVETAIATILKEFVEGNAGKNSARIKKLNNISHQLHNAKKGLSPITAKSDATGSTVRGVNPFLNLPAQMVRGVGDALGGGETGMLLRADMGQAVGGVVDKIPYRAKEAIGTAIRSEPARMVGEELGRSPQSVPGEGGSVNFMVADTDIPRSTEFAMEHPKLFVAKVLQAAGPEWAMKFQMAIGKNDKRTLETTLPMFAQQYPEVFENDEFNIFDGKIVDPNDRQRYSESVYMREDISDYEKAEMLDHLNKHNEVLQ